MSKLILPATGHAWVEVIYDEKIYVFDPTPKNKDRKTKENEGASVDPEKQKKFDDETFPADESEEDKSDENSGDGEEADEEADEKADEGKEGKNDGKDSKKPGKSQDKAEDNTNGEEAAAEFEKTKEKSGLKEEEIAQVQAELEKNLEIGSLTLKENNQQSNRVVDRAVRMMVRDMVAPQFETGASLQRLLTLRADVKKAGQTRYMKILKPAEEALTYRQGPVVDSLLGISGDLRSKPLAFNYRRLLQVQDRIKSFLELSEQDVRSREMIEAMALIRTVQDGFLRLTQPGSHEVAVVKKFMKEAPPHTRQVFAGRYGISDIDREPSVETAFKALKNGKVQDLNLIRLLYPMTEFIQDAVPSPAYTKIRAYDESSRSKARPQVVAATNLNRAGISFRGQPEKSYVDNLLEGTLYLRTRRRQIDVPRPGGTTDPKRVTIALYDKSGSMSGDSGDFQAALLASFVDRALSDRGPSGQYRHLVELMAFDSVVYEPVPVRNSHEAYDVIKNHRSTMANTGGGTEIMIALEQAFAAVLDAQNRAGEPLASANIILMSDGQDNKIDLEKIRKWIAAIDRRTPIKVMFVGINGTNPELEKLAHSMKSVGAKESYYREFTTEDITDWIRKSKEVPKVDERRDYHTKAHASELYAGAESDLDRASLLVRKAIASYEHESENMDHSVWDRELQQIPFRAHEDPTKRTDFEQSLHSFRTHIEISRSYENSRNNRIVSADMRKNMGVLTGRELSGLNSREVESLRWAVTQLQQKLERKK
jgi:hypothetical protein